ncbi:MAG: hypothetical protein J0I34_03085 [Pseudonocardia sp.]|uniref:hypothetical protein n=1 Tax=unclassified Pseudonocardia TaxID=2619320 RepID=UPI00086A5372|nr:MULTISPECIES: hypothetical protein [unclassified Pseudonocardia]MBN9107744.1 hypothetical protein [Pseudonocardia sp.]ODU19597.1 MAG: hypothetical protein ABS80_19175 [Pseudonocardia sp. SCN 72-51]ODV07546.1 MAG: hypothetical protein ABT15_08680 [Pseudonocardia sp. SCN 73-27]
MTSPDADAGATCGGHPGVAGEARTLLAGLIDRLQPTLDRYATAAPAAGDPDATPVACASCPVCAVIAVLRGERPELAAQLAEHASGLLAVLRAALDEGNGAAAPPAPPAGTDQPSRPTVQRITVTRG